MEENDVLIAFQKLSFSGLYCKNVHEELSDYFYYDPVEFSREDAIRYAISKVLEEKYYIRDNLIYYKMRLLKFNRGEDFINYTDEEKSITKWQIYLEYNEEFAKIYNKDVVKRMYPARIRIDLFTVEKGEELIDEPILNYSRWCKRVYNELEGFYYYIGGISNTLNNRRYLIDK